MAYSTSVELLSAWADKTETEAGATRIAKAIAYADGIIDTYLCNRYTVPLSPIPDIINGFSIDLALFIVKKRKDPRMVTQEEAENASMALNLLEKIRIGELPLPNVAQEQLVSSPMEDFTPIVNLDDETNWVVDEDLEEEIEDDRD